MALTRCTTYGPFQTREDQLKFQHYNLGYVQAGDIVEVSLQGSAANVRLLDSGNFQNYRNGRQHRFHGGLAQRSPVRLQVPSSNNWHLVVDFQGLSGTVRSSIRVIPNAALRPLQPIQEPSLRSIPTLLRNPIHEFGNDAEDPSRSFDVFISHASEDKDEIVRPLAVALKESGLSVWFDEFELKIGDSLRRKIDKGLVSSRFGIVVLSKAFFGRGWTEYELDGLVTRAISGEQVLLPVWHGVTKKEVIDYSPSLADKLARNTTNYTVEEIAKEIYDVIKNPTI